MLHINIIDGNKGDVIFNKDGDDDKEELGTVDIQSDIPMKESYFEDLLEIFDRDLASE